MTKKPENPPLNESPAGPAQSSEASMRRRRGQRLRFRQIRNMDPPRGFINLDAALDRLGESRLGVRWDECVHSTEFPFRYDATNREFYSYRFELSQPYRFVREPIDISVYRSPRYKKSAQLYHRIYMELMRAAEGGFVQLRILGRAGYFGPLPYMNMLATQTRRIFYTGTFVFERDGRKELHRMLVDTESFERWLNGAGEPNSVYSASRPVGYAAFRPLLPLLVERALNHEYSIVRSKMEQLFKDAAERTGVELSNSAIEKLWAEDCLDPVRQKKGTRSTANRAAFEADIKELEKLILMHLSTESSATPISLKR